jgi:hypothetical protein
MPVLQNEIHKSVQSDSEIPDLDETSKLDSVYEILRSLYFFFYSVWSVAIIYQKVDRGFEMTSHDTPRPCALRARRSESFPRRS